jgi:uncharacterized protein
VSLNKKEDLLLIFTKNPVLGKVKTRLAKDIGEENALKIYEFLLDHSVKVTAPLEVSKQVCYSDSVIENDIWDHNIFSKKAQSGNDLGERMHNAFKDAFSAGFKKVVIIGSDLFDLETGDLEKAFAELEEHNFVLGPAQDGGYYLFGMKSLNSKVFKNKDWGTSSVLKDTLADLENRNVKLLETRNDIDLLEDLKDHPALEKFIKYDQQN